MSSLHRSSLQLAGSDSVGNSISVIISRNNHCAYVLCISTQLEHTLCEYAACQVGEHTCASECSTVVLRLISREGNGDDTIILRLVPTANAVHVVERSQLDLTRCAILIISHYHIVEPVLNRTGRNELRGVIPHDVGIVGSVMVTRVEVGKVNQVLTVNRLTAYHITRLQQSDLQIRRSIVGNNVRMNSTIDTVHILVLLVLHDVYTNSIFPKVALGERTVTDRSIG